MPKWRSLDNNVEVIVANTLEYASAGDACSVLVGL